DRAGHRHRHVERVRAAARLAAKIDDAGVVGAELEILLREQIGARHAQREQAGPPLLEALDRQADHARWRVLRRAIVVLSGHEIAEREADLRALDRERVAGVAGPAYVVAAAGDEERASTRKEQ